MILNHTFVTMRLTIVILVSFIGVAIGLAIGDGQESRTEDGATLFEATDHLETFGLPSRSQPKKKQLITLGIGVGIGAMLKAFGIGAGVVAGAGAIAAVGDSIRNTPRFSRPSPVWSPPIFRRPSVVIPSLHLK